MFKWYICYDNRPLKTFYTKEEALKELYSVYSHCSIYYTVVSEQHLRELSWDI